MKRILILCTGNSCRSIIAEGMLRQELKGQAEVLSSGVRASGWVHPASIEILRELGYGIEGLHSKTLDTVMGEYDAVLTVCDHAKETCPVFPGNAKKLHFGIEDPMHLGKEGFEKTAQLVKSGILPLLKKELGLS